MTKKDRDRNILIGGAIVTLLLIVMNGDLLGTKEENIENRNDIIKNGISQSQDVTEVCSRSGGEWKKLFTSCKDNCITDGQICTQILVMGCDCGTTKCWNQNSCVDGRSSIDPIKLNVYTVAR